MGGRVDDKRKHPVIICRCNDVTLDDVERVIEEGCQDIECIRKTLGIGMGPCQGRTCIPLLMSIIARKTGKRVEQLPLPSVRAPIIPIPIYLLLKSLEDSEGGDK